MSRAFALLIVALSLCACNATPQARRENFMYHCLGDAPQQVAQCKDAAVALFPQK